MDEEAPPEKRMLVLTVEFEEFLQNTMSKLRSSERGEYDKLMKKHPDAKGINDMADPRRNEVKILGERKNM